MKIFIETVGCKLNQFESQALAESFEGKDFLIAGTLEEADFVVVNTCSVTNRADIKSRQVMKRAKKLGKKVVATGCYATMDYLEIKNGDYADIIVKNNAKFSIPEIIEGRIRLEEELSELKTAGEFPIVRQFERTRAFVKIQDGCDKFCAYCRIPHARGRSRSLAPEAVVKFVGSLVESGYKEVVLTGINISDYRSGPERLYDLLIKVLEIPGDFRLRLSSLQPDEFDVRILELLDTGKLANHFHLSLQSGSKGVLKRMKRDYTPELFLSITGQIRQYDESCGLTTDIIAGFPEETEEEFEETVRLIKEAEFSRAHIFPYSSRPHTAAAVFKDLPADIKKERVRALEEEVYRSAAGFIDRSVLGRDFHVLLETHDNEKWTGYTSNYIKVHTRCNGQENTFIDFTPSQIVRNGSVPELID